MFTKLNSNMSEMSDNKRNLFHHVSRWRKEKSNKSPIYWHALFKLKMWREGREPRMPFLVEV
ncbi:CLUMA_CG013862, isoform A [Clunio marinus]|uniref:CLUMA_CG013862, isoform A n=1 Tax=Clunio marinus TaxID=568069 RepID=A0A1J1ILG8_9DIPT|nr:CLUMA_CG013862, isoform A [Clunio marinus]